MSASVADPYPIASGTFLAAAGLRLEELAVKGLNSIVRGKLDVDERHHTPWGVVHGGVWATAIESAASLGASAVVQERGQFAVGVDNLTDFLRPVRAGTLVVIARPAQIGRSLQLWEVEINDAEGRTVARGRVRLANQSLPSA
ncbi:PaaI family thioesterase [Micromonospora sp. NPDC050397]|uniref:PaaI family thioesterase n=1 Tax=Micromonospora sp. NPDC050397 TaxID=3364279 RepID=UPI00384B44D5